MDYDELLKKFEFIVNTSREFMTMINRDYRYEAANNSYCRAHNRTHDEVIGKTISDIWGKEKSIIIKNYINDCFTGKEVQYQSWFEFPALGLRCFEVYCYPFFENGIVTSMVVISRDITERKMMEKKVFLDPLTGLYNFRYISRRLIEEFERAERYGLNLSLIFADIDHFKAVNDKLGHQTGNEVLVHIGNILYNTREKNFGTSQRLRKVDIVSRYGGEEFVALLPETKKSDAEVVAERIRHTVENYNFPHYEKNRDVGITVSIGVAAFPDDGIESGEDLVQKADLAMYRAKNMGRNRVCLYSKQ